MARKFSAWPMAILGFTILVFSMGVGRFAFTPLLPLMQADGLVSVSDGGVLAALHFVGYAMGALAAVRLRSSPALTLIVSLLLIGLSTITMGVSNNFMIWGASRWIAGVCSALALVVVSTQFIQRLAELDRAELQGWVFAGVGGGTALVGMVALPLMLSGAEAALGWQIFGFATLAACAAVYLSMSSDVFRSPSEAAPSEAAASPIAWQIVLPYGAMGAGYIIPATYLPIMARDIVDSPLVFGWVWPVFGAAAAISTVLSARLYRIFSNRQVWVSSQVIMALGLVLPAIWSEISAVAIAGVCVGGTFMVITMAGIKEAHRVADGRNPQSLIAAMTAAFAFGQIIGPPMAGWAFQTTDSFAYPLILASVVLLVTLMPLMMLARNRDNKVAGI